MKLLKKGLSNMSDKKTDRVKSTVPPLPPLPPLVELPVYRGIYCSQEMTDAALRHLWEEKSELVRELAAQEMRPDPRRTHGDAVYNKAIDRVISYLRQEESKKTELPLSRIGMLDVVYELSRRLRKGLGLPDLEILGIPLVKKPDSAYPVLLKLPIWTLNNGKPRSTLTQEMIDTTLQAAYERRPDLFYEISEQSRRSMRSYEIRDEFEALLKEITPAEVKKDVGFVGILHSEAKHRLFEMCKMSISPDKKQR